MKELDKYRSDIAAGVRELRKRRRWTQAELADRLGLSQSRLSQVERGDGSFTAEQFLLILQLFNVPLSEFTESDVPRDSQLQNALARLGAIHLQERSDVAPDERLDELADVVAEALVSGSPRLVTALGPVLVLHANRLGSLRRTQLRLLDIGLERRLGWLAENVLSALHQERGGPLSTAWRKRYQRASVVLRAYLDSVGPGESRSDSVPDILDESIRSERTRAHVSAGASEISRRWNIITSLQPDDFSRALRAARGAD